MARSSGMSAAGVHRADVDGNGVSLRMSERFGRTYTVDVPLTNQNLLARKCPNAKSVLRWLSGLRVQCPIVPGMQWPGNNGLPLALVVPCSNGEPSHATVQWRRTSALSGNVASKRPSFGEPGSVRSGSKDQNVGEPGKIYQAFDSSWFPASTGSDWVCWSVPGSEFRGVVRGGFLGNGSQLKYTQLQ